MKTQITVLGASHYDMSKEGGSVGASIKLFGGTNNTNNYFGVAVSDSDIPYEELSKFAHVKFPAVFEAELELGVVKKNGSKKEVTAAIFNNLKFLHTVEFLPVKVG